MSPTALTCLCIFGPLGLGAVTLAWLTYTLPKIKRQQEDRK